jgi:isopropylmalate/homocitrate/citramalate synthase
VAGAIDRLIHDWNVDFGAPGDGGRQVSFDDETLRDGLQSPSVSVPSPEQKAEFLDLVERIGVRHADVGLPGAGPRAARDVEALCRAAVERRLALRPNCAARTLESDIVPVLAIAARIGRPIELMLFLGSSPIRAEVEGWTLEDLVARTERWVGFAVERGLPVTFVTEDTTRSRPGHLRRIYQAAARTGASRVCVADTAGHATPLGAWAVVRFVREVLDECGAESVGIDWHGHNDRGLAVANALAAAYAGADRLHGTALGIGERVGNAPIEQLLVNSRLLGWSAHALDHLATYVEHASRMLGVAVPAWAPMVGRDAFRTSTGVHAAAILKARERGEEGVADLVYSAVPASWLGRRQVIDVGPMSGVSNVRCWLREHGYEETPALIERLFGAGKDAERTLSDEELHRLVAGS